MTSFHCRSAVLIWVAAALFLLLGTAANAQNQRLSASEADLVIEQAYLDALTLRYSVEIPDDENLPLSLRKRDSPKGASLLNLSW